MTEHKPIFFDRVKANIARHMMHTPFGPVADTDAHTADGMSLRTVMTKAVPFVIDDDAVEKALEVRQKFLADPKVPLIDLALVPFGETWIEYNPAAKFAPEERDETFWMRAHNTGHLIVRGEHGASVMTFEGWHKDILTMPYVINWSFTGKGRGWYQVIGTAKRYVVNDDSADILRAMLLTGSHWMPDWAKRVGGDLVNPQAETVESAEAMGKKWSTIFKEHASVVSLLMSILALIAWCPVEVSKHKPRGMFLHNRKPRPYMEHNVVHLRIPIRTAYSYIRKGAVEAARKRRHRVREHFRVYHAGTPKERRVLVHEHMRGDASLGYVKQEYEVST